MNVHLLYISTPMHSCILQVLHNLPDLEVINFGDCLVKPQGALAIGEALKEKHFNLKVFMVAPFSFCITHYFIRLLSNHSFKTVVR